MGSLKKPTGLRGFRLRDEAHPHHWVTGLAGSIQLEPARRVNKHQHEIARFQGLMHLLQHAAVKLRGGLVHAGRVDKDDLCRGMNAFARGHLNYAGDAVTRGLGLGGDDGDLFPVSALSSVLLPTLGRPRMATNPDFNGRTLQPQLSPGMVDGARWTVHGGRSWLVGRGSWVGHSKWISLVCARSSGTAIFCT